MKLTSIARPTATTAIAVGALVVALGGSAAVASGSLQKGDQLIKKHTLSGNRLKANTVTGAQVKESTLGTVPSADTAQTAITATRLPALVWQPLTLQNGWAAYNGGTYGGNPQYAIDAQGFVHLRGAVSGSAKTGDVVATLPNGFRPSEPNVWLPVASTNNASDPQRVALDILSTGEITAEGTGGANFAFLSLAGLTFPAG